MSVHHLYIPTAHRSQNRESYTMEVESQMVVSIHVGVKDLISQGPWAEQPVFLVLNYPGLHTHTNNCTNIDS